MTKAQPGRAELIPTGTDQLAELIHSVVTEHGINSREQKELLHALIEQEGDTLKAMRFWMRSERKALYQLGGLKQRGVTP